MSRQDRERSIFLVSRGVEDDGVRVEGSERPGGGEIDEVSCDRYDDGES